MSSESGRSAVSSQVTGVGPDGGAAGEFGANEWLVEELYEQYKVDRNSVDPSWWPILDSYHKGSASGGDAAAPAQTASAAAAEAAASAPFRRS